MGNFQSVLKSLRTANSLTQGELAKILNISRSTIGMYENGSREPDYETLESIADFFNVDIDYLLGRTTKTTKIIYPNTLTPKDERDIEKILESTKDQLLSQEGLMFDGKPASQEAIDSILLAMQIGMEAAKKKNKEKYTPKKYRKNQYE